MTGRRSRPPRPSEADQRRATGGGLLAFALFMAGLGATSLVFQVNLPGLQPAPETGWLALSGSWLSGGLILIAALGLLVPSQTHLGVLILTAVWTFWVLFGHLSRLAGAPGDLTAWVSVSQVLVLAATGLAVISEGAIGPARRVLVGLMLVLFGVVHLVYPDAIASLLTEGFPVRDLWPWMTGPLQILAGLAILSNRARGPAAAVIAAMFLSWIPLVHLPRVIADPTSAFEWTFMLTAGALAGAVRLAGAGSGGRHGVQLARSPERPDDRREADVIDLKGRVPGGQVARPPGAENLELKMIDRVMDLTEEGLVYAAHRGDPASGGPHRAAIRDQGIGPSDRGCLRRGGREDRRRGADRPEALTDRSSVLRSEPDEGVTRQGVTRRTLRSGARGPLSIPGERTAPCPCGL